MDRVGGVWLLWKRLKQYLEYRGRKLPPVYREGLHVPLLGAALQFLSDPLKMARRAQDVHGDIFTVYVLGKRLTFMCGPDAQENFCRARDDELSQQQAYKFSVPLFGPGVVYDADLEKRTEQIKFVTNSLHTTAIGQYVPMMVDEAEKYFASWGDEGVVDIYTALAELIILTASRCLMGPEIRSELHKEVSELYAILDKGCTPISFFAPYFPIPAHFRRDKARRQMVALFQKVIEKRRKENKRYNDVLQVYMDATYKNGDKLPAHEVTGLLIALLFAGQHTSSVTSSWTGLYMLDNKKDIIPKLVEEQKKVGKVIDHEAIKNMSLLHATVSEALRMQPPLIFVMREVLQDRQFKDYTIPKGDVIFLSPSLSGRRPDVWTNPDSFDPFRFLEPREEHRKFSHGWLGFGGGRHRCLGEHFAYVQIKTIWAYLLRNFEMEAVGPLPSPNYEALVVGPKHPCLIRYVRRKLPID
ncbi:p450 superfamily protein [Guillardia theta CCMP2712]|uniref:p450 superfamily protein n=1 Tax=Guillardia theta (strain CCMP2712) TaxID=905079 RepID=L1IUN2_GUITC|nr:p450 superfamily protein [Guillardia theta CCMP2712]EKX39609.1 p450 superfamily protein [Guillardia theta CCMP2712]|eukprot:XP_005826589.1 p450 superfamily protein [Guillardia theta CCMP2712]